MTERRIVCPKCKKWAQTMHTRFGSRNFCCDLWSWGKGNPLVDATTHDARKAAHAAFDPLWKGSNALISRGRAYKELASRMGLTKYECHMKLMTAEQASNVPDMAADIRNKYTNVGTVSND